MVEEYISREKLLKLYVDGEFDTGEYHVSVPVIIQNIKDIPAADVREVVRGKWELRQVSDAEGGDKWNRWFCSECGHNATAGWEHTRYGAKPKYNFCPNCGADMREG